SYLVQFGRSAFVGRFRFAGDRSLARGDRVVLRGPRGLELGTILCEPVERSTQPREDDGELVRAATADDECAAECAARIGHEVLATADTLVAESDLPLSFVDIEVSLDASTAVLHGLPWAACDASSAFAALSERFGLA